jgi:hypothetical protein
MFIESPQRPSDKRQATSNGKELLLVAGRGKREDVMIHCPGHLYYPSTR